MSTELRERPWVAEPWVEHALRPPELHERPGVDVAAASLPASESVGGDFYLVAAGPRDATVLVVGDAMGHGPAAARCAAFTRAVFAATAQHSDDPGQLLDRANAALMARAGDGVDFVTAACVVYLPRERRLRWAYAGHPPALWLDDPRELPAPQQGTPLGLTADPGCVAGSRRLAPRAGMLLYTDGLTEARQGKRFFGLDGLTATLGRLEGRPSPTQAIDALRMRVAAFAGDALTDDLCLLAARFG